MEDEIGIVALEHVINQWLARCPPVAGALVQEVELLATLYGQMICAGRQTVREREVLPQVWRLIVEGHGTEGGTGGSGARG